YVLRGLPTIPVAVILKVDGERWHRLLGLRADPGKRVRGPDAAGLPLVVGKGTGKGGDRVPITRADLAQDVDRAIIGVLAAIPHHVEHYWDGLGSLPAHLAQRPGRLLAHAGQFVVQRPPEGRDGGAGLLPNAAQGVSRGPADARVLIAQGLGEGGDRRRPVRGSHTQDGRGSETDFRAL